MPNSEAIVGIASRMYEARSALRALWGAEYGVKIQPAKDLVQRKAAEWRCSELEACISIVKCIINSHPHATMTVLAATVELIEPSGMEAA